MDRPLVHIDQAHSRLGPDLLNQSSRLADYDALLGFPFHDDVRENPNLGFLNFDIFDMYVQGVGNLLFEEEIRAFSDDFADPVIHRGIRIIFRIEQRRSFGEVLPDFRADIRYGNLAPFHFQGIFWDFYQVPQVGFGKNFDNWGTRMLDLGIDGRILRSNGPGNVPNPHYDIGLLERNLGFLTEPLSHRIVMELEPRSVDEQDLAIVIGVYPQERMPGRVRDLAHRCQGLAYASVQYGRFSDVRPSDDGHVPYFHFLEFMDCRISLILFAKAWLAREGFIRSNMTPSNTMFGPFMQFHWHRQSSTSAS